RRGGPARPRGGGAPYAGLGMTAAIADHAIVGDCRSAALISREGSVDWLCWPRFDSASLFAAILDEDRGGRFAIAPAGPFRSERGYLGETNVLQTRFFVASGELTLTDFMPALMGADALRQLQPGHELIRIARCERGEVEVAILFDPRPDYGRLAPRMRALGKLGLRVDAGGGAMLTLLTDAPLGPEGRARVRLRDAALTARALFGLGHGEEAENFMSWLLNATSLSLPELHVLYDLYGRRPRPEIELPHLAGHGGARPVRIGNAAAGQVQLDTYG